MVRAVREPTPARVSEEHPILATHCRVDMTPDNATMPTPGSGGRPSRVSAVNAKEILSGKRERELFDPDEARRQAAAKRAAAAAERERAEEEMIARWKEEDRAKAEAARQKAAAVAGTADGAAVGARVRCRNGCVGKRHKNSCPRYARGASVGWHVARQGSAAASTAWAIVPL